jgi:hypothetical protein
MKDAYSVGRALGLGLSSCVRNFIPFTILAVVISSPALIYAYTTLTGEVGLADLENFEQTLCWIQRFTGMLLTSTLTFGVIRELTGDRASIARCIGTGLKRFFPVLGISVIVFVIVLVPTLLLAIVFSQLFFGVFGLILVVVVGALIECVYFVAIPASVIEGGVAGALLRSRELTAGHRLGILATLLILFGCQLAVGYGLGETIIASGSEAEVLASFRTAFWIHLGATIVLSVVTGAVAAVTYYLLRAEKEGTSAGELAAVFE